jgi:dihydroxyacetone synthase
MRASGWHVLEVADGSYDVQSIVSALEYAKTLKDKPTFVNIRTVIGLGTQVAGTYKAHHGAFDLSSIEASKRLAGQDPTVKHVIPPAQLEYFRERKTHGESIQKSWDGLVREYSTVYPAQGEELSRRRSGDYGTEWLEILKQIDTAQFQGNATREVNGAVIEKLWAAYPGLCGGGADLVNSNKFPYIESDVFHPSVGYAGRYIRYGIREHAMAAISNGLAAYNPGTFLPLTATFLMFYLYVSLHQPRS